VGNAAQSLHPIAGQGFNLGLRDIYTLISTLQSERLNKSSVDKDGEFDPGQFNVLNTYAKKRKKDRAATITLTDTLVHTFSNQHFPLVVGRNVSLMALSMVPFAKKQFVKQTTGYGLGAR
jgi:2-octaprenyl-6-methoxyphenol hydroxylase